MAASRIQLETPQPMEIGAVGGKGEQVPPPGLGDWECGVCGEEQEVDWVGTSTICLRCDGVGHLARNCGTTKGKGIETKGKGK